MFSYFRGGITKTTSSKSIKLPELITIIQNNPQKELIQDIRTRRINGDISYKKKKRSLNYITPNCVVHQRKLEGINFEKNFIQASGYIYFDFDVKTNVDQFKSSFIKKYGHIVSMVCLSSSSGGISVLFKLSNPITKDNFEPIWHYIKDTYLVDEIIDESTKDIGRAMFLTFDPEVYFNFENSITIPDHVIINQGNNENKKCVTQRISCSDINNTLNYAFSLIPIGQVLKVINISTPVTTINPVLDYAPVDYTDVRFPKEIKDGIKHKLYKVMIHRLVYLNQNLPVNYIYSYLHFVNQHFAYPPMEQKEFDSHFKYVYQKTQTKDYKFENERIKNIHFNPSSGLTGEQKSKIANKLNGKLKVNRSIELIKQAKHQLQSSGKKITKTSIEKITGLSRKTVIAHFDSEIQDINGLVDMYNDSIDVPDTANNKTKHFPCFHEK
jgi:hypothetical protein